MSMVPPPFDPEFEAALGMIKDMLPPMGTLDTLVAMRQGAALSHLAELDLTTGGAFALEDRLVPGPEGAPEISLLICRPLAPAERGPLPVIHNIPGLRATPGRPGRGDGGAGRPLDARHPTRRRRHSEPARGGRRDQRPPLHPPGPPHPRRDTPRLACTDPRDGFRSIRP